MINFCADYFKILNNKSVIYIHILNLHLFIQNQEKINLDPF